MEKWALWPIAWLVLVVSATATSARELQSPGPAPPGSDSLGLNLKETVLLIITDIFSIMLSMCPFIIFKSTGSWSMTRRIFPVKSVLCNFGGAFKWAIYMNFQMYLSYGYSGLDALLVNCLSMAFNVTVLLAYFKDGKEHRKFIMCLAGSIALVSVFVVILVIHPYGAKLSGQSVKLLNSYSTITAILGIVIQAVLNLIPFRDLWNMSQDEDRDVTLDWPMLLCTVFNCFVCFLWTTYAWVFPSSAPNYFLIANLIAAILSLVQCFWLGVVCLHHRMMEGQIRDVETLRASFLKLATALDNMAAVSEIDAFWNRIEFFRDLRDDILIGTQYLCNIRLALVQELPILQEKETTATACTAQIKSKATTLANNAATIVQGAVVIANQGTTAATMAKLAKQEVTALKAYQDSRAAIASLAQRRDPPLAQQEQAQDAEKEAGNVDASTDAQAPRASCAAKDLLELSMEIQKGYDVSLSASVSHTIAVADAVSSEADACAARYSCNDLIAACDICISAFEAVSMAIKDKIADVKGDAQALNAEDAKTLQDVRILALRSAIKGCAPCLRFLSSRVRSSLQVINATVGIPVAVREGLRNTNEHMVVLKIAVNSPFLWQRLKMGLKRIFCFKQNENVVESSGSDDHKIGPARNMVAR